MKRKYIKPIVEDLSGISVCLLAGSVNRVNTTNVTGAEGDRTNVYTGIVEGDGLDMGAHNNDFDWDEN